MLSILSIIMLGMLSNYLVKTMDVAHRRNCVALFEFTRYPTEIIASKL